MTTPIQGQAYNLYLSPNETSQIKQNAATRQLIERAAATRYITPEQFGARGDGITDDTSAVQAAINTALTRSNNAERNVYLPGTYYTATGVSVAPASGQTFFSIFGAGKQVPTLVTTHDVPLLTFDVANGDLYYASVSNMAFLGSTSFTTNLDGILIKNNDPHFFNYYNFSNLFFQKLYHSIFFTSTGNNCDWGIINNVNLNNVGFGIRRLGGGTGCVYWGGNIVLSGVSSGAAISIGDTSTAATRVVGDIIIGGYEMGGTGAGVVLNGGSYGSNITISNMQMDAGINPAFNLVNVHSFEARNINWGGASGPNLIDPSCTDLYLDEIRATVVSTSTTTQNDLSVAIGHGRLEYVVSGGDLTITGIAGGYDSRLFEIYNGGTSNNVVIKNESTGSLAANRFHINADATIGPGQSMTLLYMGNNGTTTTNRWVRRGGV